MSAGASLQYSRSAGRQQRLALDPVILVTVFGLLLVGLVMVSSASLNVAERLTGDPYYHFERQFFSVLLGCTFGAAMLVVPIATWKRLRAVAAGRQLRAPGPGAGFQASATRSTAAGAGSASGR